MLYNSLLIIHIAAGGLALIVGGTAAFARKGKKTHKGSGRLFALSMLATAISAVCLSLLKSTPFLLGIGFFSLYLILSGWMWARPLNAVFKRKMSRIVGLFGCLAALYMIYRGMVAFDQLNYVLLIFGVLLSGFSLRDFFPVNTYRAQIVNHASKMGGAYIAATTAFLVVNIEFSPELLLWIGPSIVGSVMISIGMRRWIRTHKE